MSGTPSARAAGRSPFKFLDPYGEGDRSIFFGREEEVATLYRLLGESRLVLVYGRSGTGKTSLIQCGLTQKFSPINWLPVMVRRGDDINAALIQAIAAQAITPIAAGTTLTEAIRSIYLDHLRPIYFMFDQFEELYVLGSRSEQERFFAAVDDILKSDVSCSIIVSLREEYLASLDRFEQVVPALFDKRQRVELMTNNNIERVILGTVAAHGISLEHGPTTARKIIAQISDNHNRVQLAYLQVYLDHLYRIDIVNGPDGTQRFDDAEVEEAGKLGDILAGFLDSQEQAIQAELETSKCGIVKGGMARLLEEFVSAEGTKQPITSEQLIARVPAAKPWLQPALEAMVKNRLLRFSDGRYELAHGALAAHIEARRSGEAKQLLQVEKLVRNRVAEFAQTKTWLNGEELALINQAHKQRDPLDGSPRLRFDDDADKFITKSKRRRRRHMITLAVIWAIGVLIPIVLGIGWLLTQQDRDNAQARASNETDVMGFATLRYVYDREVRKKDCVDSDPNCKTQWEEVETKNQNAMYIEELGATANSRRELPTDAPNDAYENNFWSKLRAADLAFLLNPEVGAGQYMALLKECRPVHENEPMGSMESVKYKAILWHIYWSRVDEVYNNSKYELLLQDISDDLFKILDKQIEDERERGYNPKEKNELGFYDDMYELCRFTEPSELRPKGCKKYDAIFDKEDLEAAKKDL